MPVLEYKMLGKISYQRVNSSLFFPLNTEEKNVLMNYWKKYKKGTFFNSENIRLEKIECVNGNTLIYVSKTDFYSLLIANIIRFQFEDFKSYILNECIDDEMIIILDKLEKYYETIKEYDDFSLMIENAGLPNALAVSVLLFDKIGNVFLVKRSSKVGIGENLYSVTATGAIDSEDWDSDDIIVNAAARELKEELNIQIPFEKFEVKAIVAGKIKMQPIAIVNVYTDFTLDGCSEKENTGIDYDLEIQKIHICNISEVKSILTKQKFTEAAEYQLSSIVENQEI